MTEAIRKNENTKAKYSVSILANKLKNLIFEEVEEDKKQTVKKKKPKDPEKKKQQTAECRGESAENKTLTETVTQKAETEEIKKTDEKEKAKIVGDMIHGFMVMPSDWIRLSVEAESNVLRWSDPGGRYVVSMGAFEKSGYDAFSYFQKNHEELVCKETADKVEMQFAILGKRWPIAAFQISGIYKSDGNEFTTYWFNGKDDSVHFISMEGDAQLKDYMNIPQSYSQTEDKGMKG